MTDPGPVKALHIAVTGWLDATYPFWRTSQPLPDGLRLEVHPAAYNALLQDPDGWRSWDGTPEGLGQAMPVPVRISRELPAHGWRLVVVTEDVKLGGTLR